MSKNTVNRAFKLARKIHFVHAVAGLESHAGIVRIIHYPQESNALIACLHFFASLQYQQYIVKLEHILEVLVFLGMRCI